MAPHFSVMPLSAAKEAEEKHSLCSGLSGAYSVGLHVFAIFLILFVSLLGTAMPIMTKYIRAFRENPFAFTVGKTAATGVLLSVSTIHLIHEGAEAFREDCVYDFFKSYDPYYFLFALIAVLMMQAIDLQLAAIAERWLRANQRGGDATSSTDVVVVDYCVAEGSRAAVPSAVGEGGSSAAVSAARENEEMLIAPSSTASPTPKPITMLPLSPNSSNCGGYGAAQTGDTLQQPRSDAVAAPHERDDKDGDVHGHQHLAVQVPMDMGSIRRVISAVCMEFGVTLHSIFVGLAIGLTTDDELKPLLFALVFHQLFEGMAMGSRLVDANFAGNLETYLALVFSFSAPAGMTIATIAASVSPDAMSGSGFVTMMAILDSFCGGILLYLAFTLLLGDFVADMKHYCADDLPGRRTRKAALYISLWSGMGLMAFVGKWL